MKKDIPVMIDIETMGTVPGSAVLSIGAYNLETQGTFYAVIDLASCFQHRLSVDASTLEWWLKQKPEAQTIFTSKNKLHLAEALQQFSSWLPDKSVCQPWGNCCMFDCVLLESAYRACKMPCPWNYTKCRSYRTAKDMIPGIKGLNYGVAHNAKDDAVKQGLHLAAILNHLSGKRSYATELRN